MRSRLAVRSLLRASQLPPARARALGSICRLPAIYSSFPASLFRYSPRQKSSLFDVKELDQRQDDPRDDAVTVSKDGLVHPYRKGQLTCKIVLLVSELYTADCHTQRRTPAPYLGPTLV
jgi:hypothetical protein